MNKERPNQILRTQDRLTDQTANVFRAPIASGTLENFKWHARRVQLRRGIVKTPACGLKSLPSPSQRVHPCGMDEHFPKDTIESLWAPWRVEYFQAEHRTGQDFLTEAAQTDDDAAHLVVARRKSAFLIMNKYPYSAGHLMAVPYRKTHRMEDLAEGEVLELWELAIHAQKLLERR